MYGARWGPGSIKTNTMRGAHHLSHIHLKPIQNKIKRIKNNGI